MCVWRVGSVFVGWLSEKTDTREKPITCLAAAAPTSTPPSSPSFPSNALICTAPTKAVTTTAQLSTFMVGWGVGKGNIVQWVVCPPSCRGLLPAHRSGDTQNYSYMLPTWELGAGVRQGVTGGRAGGSTTRLVGPRRPALPTAQKGAPQIIV